MATTTENDGAATEHAQVLLRAEDIHTLRAAERAAPKRSLHKLARKALNTITEAGPNSTVDRDLGTWFPWQSYVANHRHAHDVIGPGITSATAEFMDSTRDGNRRGQNRLDFVF